MAEKDVAYHKVVVLFDTVVVVVLAVEIADCECMWALGCLDWLDNLRGLDIVRD